MKGVHKFDAVDHLDNPEVIAAYLKEALETGDAAFIAHAVRTVVRAYEDKGRVWKGSTKEAFKTILSEDC